MAGFALVYIWFAFGFALVYGWRMKCPALKIFIVTVFFFLCLCPGGGANPGFYAKTRVFCCYVKFIAEFRNIYL